MRIRTMIAALAVAVGVSGVAYAGSSPWFDRDNQSGKGDYETMADLMKLECRLKTNQQIVTTGNPDAGYTADVAKGCYCENGGNGNNCQDLEARWTWTGGATPWFDRDDPSGDGDYETLVDLMTVSCRVKGAGTAITEGSPRGWHLSVGAGCYCVNAENGNQCTDGEVQWSWP